jgi:hypothetical protein
MNEVTDCYWHMVDVLLTRRAAKRKRQTMVLTVGGLAGRPPIDKRCRSQRSGRVALCDCILAKVLLLCLTTVPCSSDETRMVVSEDTSKKIFTKPSSISFALEFFLVRGQSVR